MMIVVSNAAVRVCGVRFGDDAETPLLATPVAGEGEEARTLKIKKKQMKLFCIFVTASRR